MLANVVKIATCIVCITTSKVCLPLGVDIGAIAVSC